MAAKLCMYLPPHAAGGSQQKVAHSCLKMAFGGINPGRKV
jgi:hypothetical protein